MPAATPTPEPAATLTPQPTPTPTLAVSLANRINALPWLADGVTDDESRAVNSLQNILREDPTVVEALLGFPWLADGATEHESWAILHLWIISREDPAVAGSLLSFPWLVDDVTGNERNVVYYLREILLKDPDAFDALMEMPWLQDTITETEADTLNYLRRIIGRNADAAAALVGMPFLDSVEDRDMLALRSLYDIAARDASGFSELMAHPKIKDGITDEETKIVAVLGAATYRYAPESAEVLLAETGVYIQERLIELPHTGETLLAVIRVEDKVTPRMDHFEHTVRSIERFMGEPFPINYLALLYYDNQSRNANNNFTHLLLMAELDTVDGPDWHAGVIAHETAHWYWRSSSEGYQYQNWIAEGSAEFLRIISEHERVGRPLDPIQPPCGFFDSISELEEANPSREFIPGKLTPRDCYYSLGERFFLDLYLALGDETFRTAYRTLYLRYQQDDRADGCGGPPLNVCRVEAVFKDGASAEVVAKVDKVIDHWYYGKVATHEGDRAELVALYRATGGANWTDSTNWLSDAHIGKWYGVTTDIEGRVTGLDLGDNGLSGDLPPGLGNLANLRELLLSDNRLRGSIPPELGGLDKLTRLELDDNGLTGTIPASLGNLTNLTWLELDDNGLTGAIPSSLGNLTGLTYLELKGNRFTGCVPVGLTNVANNDFAELGLPSC